MQKYDVIKQDEKVVVKENKIIKITKWKPTLQKKKKKMTKNANKNNNKIRYNKTK